MKAKTISISGKCSDMFSMGVYDANGCEIYDHEGYVPSFFPQGGGDYISLEIDLETGKILNWTPPTSDTDLMG